MSSEAGLVAKNSRVDPHDDAQRFQIARLVEQVQQDPRGCLGVARAQLHPPAARRAQQHVGGGDPVAQGFAEQRKPQVRVESGRADERLDVGA